MEQTKTISPKFFSVETSIFVARLFAIIFVFLFFLIGGEQVAYNFYSPFLMAHYFMALVFLMSWKKIQSKGNRYIASLIALTLISVGLTGFQAIHILIYFGIHFVMTEIYLPRYLGVENSLSTTLSRVPFTILCYTFFIKHALFISDIISAQNLFILVIVSFVGMVLWNWKNKLPFPLFEAPLILVVIISFVTNTDFPFYTPIFYHIMLWLALPILKIGSASWKLILLHFALYGAFVFIGHNDTTLTMAQYCRPYHCVGFFAYFHITSAFATSILNPVILQKFFGFIK